MNKLQNTQYFKVSAEQELQVGDILKTVYQAMTERDIIQ